MSNNKQRSGNERLNDLEQALMSLYQMADNMARDLMTIKEAIELLGSKTSAVAELAGVKDEDINGVMVRHKVEKLKNIVDGFVAQGIFASVEEIAPNSFVVGKEHDGEKVVIPRSQFSIASLSPEVSEKLLGKKVGDTVEFDGKLSFTVLEVYSIQQPSAPSQEVQPSEESVPAQESSEAASS